MQESPAFKQLMVFIATPTCPWSPAGVPSPSAASIQIQMSTEPHFVGVQSQLKRTASLVVGLGLDCVISIAPAELVISIVFAEYGPPTDRIASGDDTPRPPKF